jgi:excinuclease ABC subunit B
MSEDLANYYTEVGVRCRYMHSEIETLERIKLLRDLRKGEYDVLIGINLLREGLDLPEVSLVAILDADKEGFLRSQGSLIQTIGRAARHLEGRAILYADKMTDSMQRAIDETDRRREKQVAYNEENGITPMSIIRPLEMGLAGILKADYADLTDEAEGMPDFSTQAELDAYIGKLESDMREAAKKFEFEKAVKLRDTVKELRTKEFRRWLRSSLTSSSSASRSIPIRCSHRSLPRPPSGIRSPTQQPGLTITPTSTATRSLRPSRPTIFPGIPASSRFCLSPPCWT